MVNLIPQKNIKKNFFKKSENFANDTFVNIGNRDLKISIFLVHFHLFAFFYNQRSNFQCFLGIFSFKKISTFRSFFFMNGHETNIDTMFSENLTFKS